MLTLVKHRCGIEQTETRTMTIIIHHSSCRTGQESKHWHWSSCHMIIKWSINWQLT